MRAFAALPGNECILVCATDNDSSREQVLLATGDSLAADTHENGVSDGQALLSHDGENNNLLQDVSHGVGDMYCSTWHQTSPTKGICYGFDGQASVVNDALLKLC